MTSTESAFYVTGGTLRQDAACYVERQADRDLLDGLLKGEFCYVLTSRQMGKSSLMVRTAGKLREQGTSVVVLDLTAIGQNLTPEQWYDGLLVRLGRQLDLEDELEEFWDAHPKMGPCQRLFAAIRDVVFRERAAGVSPAEASFSTANASQRHPASGRLAARSLVLFLDEIDVVRSLPFSSDEFFAAIRECYNRRTEDAEFNRLTFCLLGVATPSDLIRDTRTTPFNIGRRIVLNDFTPQEAAPLAGGLQLGRGGSERKAPWGPRPFTGKAGKETEALLDRVLYWTNGHPYLTQRLCQAVAAEGGVTSSSGVDRLCDELFFSSRAKERDDNLLFVRERLLRNEADLASLLHLYEQVRARRPVPDDETNPLVSILGLSGIARVFEGLLRLRNRIYEQVFDRAWVRANMPDAEVRRQKAAFRRGLIRATGVAAVVLGIMAALVAMATRQAHRASQTANALRRNVYATDMKLAQVSLDENNLGRAAELVQKYFPLPGQEDLRGFEWRYLWKLCQGDAIAAFQGHQRGVTSVAFSPDEQVLATASWDGTVHLWARTLTNPPAPFKSFTLGRPLSAVAFSPNGRILAAADDGEIHLWHTVDWQPLGRVRAPAPGALHRQIRFSKDGRMLAARTSAGVAFFDTETWKQIMTLGSEGGGFGSPTDLSQDGKLLAATRDRQIELWDLSSQARVTNFVAATEQVWSVAFSPRDNLLATGDETGVVRLWDTSALQEVTAWKAHANYLLGLRFSPDGAILATGGGDQVIRCWNVTALRQWASNSTSGPGTASQACLATLRGHHDQVWALAFSSDGRFLVSGSQDETARLWSVRPEEEQRQFTNAVILLWLSPDGQTMAALNKDARGDAETVALAYWAVASGKQISTVHLPTDVNAVSHAAISPNGKYLAFGLTNGVVDLWALETKSKQTTLKGHDGAVDSIRFSSNNQRLATRDESGTIRVWDLEAATELARFPSAGLFALSSDGQLLVTAGAGATLWHVSSKRILATLEGHKRRIASVSFSPDGNLVATSSSDSTARLWSVPSGRLVAVLKGHIAGVDAVAFSHDGKTLVTGGNDDTVKLWNVATQNEMLTLKDSNKRAQVMFSEDGTTLAVGYPYLRNGTQHVQFWRTPSLAEIDALGSAVGKKR